MVAKGPAGADNGPMPTDAKQLDTQIEIVTPENIAFQYRLPVRSAGCRPT